MRWILIGLVYACFAIAQEGVISLDPKKSYLEIYFDAGLPVLQFRNSDKVKLELNQEGLFVQGKKACGWPDGRFDVSQAHNMVLGFSSLKFLNAEKYEYKACPADVPIKSTWGDGGTGAATLYVELDELVGDKAFVKFQGEKLVLSLKIPGLSFRVVPPKKKKH